MYHQLINIQQLLWDASTHRLEKDKTMYAQTEPGWKGCHAKKKYIKEEENDVASVDISTEKLMDEPTWPWIQEWTGKKKVLDI